MCIHPKWMLRLGLVKVFVFEGGRLAEYGSHDSLLARGAYAVLWKKQSGFHVTPDGSQGKITPERLGQVPILSGLISLNKEPKQRNF